MKINYRGDLLAPSGYGRAARAHVRALLEVGVDVAGRISQHDTTQLDLSNDSFWGPRHRKLLADNTVCPVCVWQETPEFFDPDPTQYNIAYTVWETSRIPDYDMEGNPKYNWVTQLNRMDEIWTASEFCKRVFVDSGVTKPINVFPHPIDLQQYFPAKPDGQWMANRLVMSGKLVFLSVFQLTKRKNPQDLILAWSAKFGRTEDVALVVKTYGATFEQADDVKNLIQAWREGARIRGMVKNLHPVLKLVEEEEMPELYRMCDVFVLPSFGEGFGMPYQEAMACGKPVIYTNASSMPEFCVGYPVECDPEPVHGMNNIPWYSASQNWWKVRVSSLMDAMGRAYDDWKRGALEARGQEARARIESLHSHKKVGNDMARRLETIFGEIRSGTCRPELHDFWAGELESLATLPDSSEV